MAIAFPLSAVAFTIAIAANCSDHASPVVLKEILCPFLNSAEYEALVFVTASVECNVNPSSLKAI